MAFVDKLNNCSSAIAEGIVVVQSALPKLAGSGLRLLLIAFFFRYLVAFSFEARYSWPFAGILLLLTTGIAGTALMVVFVAAVAAQWGKRRDQVQANFLTFLLVGVAPILVTSALASWTHYQFKDWLLNSSSRWAKDFFDWVANL